MTIVNNESLLANMLSGRGVRLTRQRRILLDAIENSSDHLHASDLLRLAREKDDRIDRATVYRTLSMLKEHGLIEELDLLHLDGSEHHYEVMNSSTHAHIGCISCGRIIEFHTAWVAELKREIIELTEWQVGSIRIEVSATCPDCVKEE